MFILTLTTKKSEKGRKRMMRKMENRVSSLAHTPGPSSQSENKTRMNKKLGVALLSSSVQSLT